MTKTIGKLSALMIAVIALFTFSVPANAAGTYAHDPMANPKAAADIIVDPNAVYGYAPNPDSPRLGSFAQYDWSDKAFVVEMRHQREEYHKSIKELCQIKANMENGGTPEYFYAKYGSWETVIEKAFATNAGADACLGLYDEYYDTYFIDSTSGNTSSVIILPTYAVTGAAA